MKRNRLAEICFIINFILLLVIVSTVLLYNITQDDMFLSFTVMTAYVSAAYFVTVGILLTKFK